ncbi:MAG: SurA N-terminal domain-containing protein [Candidatus Omnitrophica bacterium]|nr:SurA N-terminal domain-containing protein [Candidatus Omnitrophota bacterium]
MVEKLDSKKRNIMRTYAIAGLVLFSLLLSATARGEEVSRIIAKINNQIITSKDLDDFCKMLAYRLSSTSEESELSPNDENFKKESLEKLIEDKLILSQAKKENIEVPGGWIEAKLNEMITSAPSRQEFEDSLTERGLTITLLRERLKDQFMVRQLIDRYVRAYIAISPQELHTFYEQHPNKFSPPLKYVLWVASSKNKNTLVEIGKVIKEKGIAVAEKEYDDVLIKLESTKDRLREEVAQMVDEVKEGNFAIKKIDETDHLIYFEKTLTPRQLSFEEAKEQIHALLWREKFKMRYQEWVTSLKAKATIKNYYR